MGLHATAVADDHERDAYNQEAGAICVLVMHAKGAEDHQSLLGEESGHNRVQAKGGERVLADRILAGRAHPGVGPSCSSGGR